MIQDYQIQEFLRQAHRVGDAGLTLCSSGNISWRIGDEALVSGTGSWVPTLPKEKVSICRVATGEVLNGVKPSMESGFHLGVLRERPDCDVVLHFQSKYATVVSCMSATPKDFNVTAEVPCHVGRDSRHTLFPSGIARAGRGREGSPEEPQLGTDAQARPGGVRKDVRRGV